MYPEVSQTIYIEVEEKGTKKQLRAMVVDSTEQEIMINYPIDEETNKFRYLMNNEKLSIFFTRNIHQEIGLYTFKTTVVRKVTGHIPYLVLQKPEKNEVVRIQRRKFLRIPASFQVNATVFDLNEEKKQDELMLVATNISGGGFGFSAIPQPYLKKGAYIQGILYFEKGKEQIMEVKFEGQIVNAMPSSHHEEQMVFGVEFKQISYRDQEMLIQYCLKRQLEMNRMSRA